MLTLLGLILLFAMLRSDLWVADYRKVIHCLPRYLGLCVLVLASVQTWTMAQRRSVFQALSLLGSAVAAKTWLRLHTGAGAIAKASMQQLYAASDAPDPNYTAFWIGLGLVCAAFLLAEGLGGASKRRYALLWLAPVAVSLAGLGACASRGMAVAAVAALTLLLVTSPTSLSSKALVLGAAALCGSAAALAGAFDVLSARLMQENWQTGNGRLDLLYLALSYFGAVAWPVKLLGGGTDSLTTAFGAHTHNAFTEQLLDYGVLGLACFAGIFLILILASLRCEGAARRSALALLTYCAIASLSISPFAFVWGWVALASAIPCSQQSRRGPGAPALPSGACV
jgi:hypothetical protein